MDLSGRCVQILETQRFVSQRSGNEIVKNCFVLESINGQYVKRVPFGVIGEDKWRSMNVVVGGSYNVSFDVEGREWNGRWFVDLVAWKVVDLSNRQYSQQVQQTVTQQQVQGQYQQTVVPQQQQVQVPQVGQSVPAAMQPQGQPQNNDLPF